MKSHQREQCEHDFRKPDEEYITIVKSTSRIAGDALEKKLK